MDFMQDCSERIVGIMAVFYSLAVSGMRVPYIDSGEITPVGCCRGLSSRRRPVEGE
jgi:hypothetical protein